MSSFNPIVNPIAKLSLVSKIKTVLNNKLRQIDGLLENFRCNIYITEMICNEIAVYQMLSLLEQQSLAYDSLHGMFGFNDCETNAVKAQIEYLHLNNLIKPATPINESPPSQFWLFRRNDSSKKKLI
jgi:hypothetical protein